MMATRHSIFVFILSVFLAGISCKHSQVAVGTADTKATEVKVKEAGIGMALPPVIIYKTKKDYSKYVPVNLSPDSKSINSYPDIKDISSIGQLAYPTILAEGYLLDNRGIGPNTAFLDYTYDQYSRLAETPSPEELLKHIIDPAPLTEIYVCKCKKDTAVINTIIKKDILKVCKSLRL